MTNTPQLDKIIGSSPILPNTFDIHYSSGVCAFPSHGYLSIININYHQRFDIQISQNFRNISALKFSSNENQIAVGELGTNSKIFILVFNKTFDQVISKLSIDTKENGFSCLAFDSKKGKLISVGVDNQPFLILWDLNYPSPIKLGYYHLSIQPNRVIFNSDCSLAVIAGEGVLKLIQTNFSYEGKPILMKSRRANFDAYSDSDFVEVYCTKGTPFNLYALCYEGKICFYQKIDDPFLKHQNNKKASLVLTPIKLSRGNLTSLAADDTVILCGGEKGTIFAFKNQNEKLKVAGKLVAMPKRVISVGISEQFIASTYEDGHLLFWKKDDLLQMDNNGKQTKNILPEITIFNHRGPICKILVIKSSHQIVTCGSDNSVRLWEIHKHQDLISNSSQEMINCCQFGASEPDYINNYYGVRTAAFLNGLLITGCNDGIVHILKIDTFDEIISFIDSIDAVTALASLESESYFASGSGDGNIRLYSVEKDDNDKYDFKLITSKAAFSTPITSLIFVNSFLFASSQTGVKFFSFPSLEEKSFYPTTEPILSATCIEKADLIATASCDCYISLFDTKSGRFFNRFTLSNNYYPVTIDSHESGLVIAVAMSDGTILVVDIVSGEPIYSFDPSLGVVTSIVFHESDLIISSFSGCIARWNLPETFHKEVDLFMKRKEEAEKKSPAILNLLDSLPKPTIQQIDIEEEESDSEDNENIKREPNVAPHPELRSSFITSKLIPKCEYENDQNEKVLDTEKSIVNDENDDDKNLNKESSEELIGDVEAPRPPPNEISPDSIIRSSIQSRKLLSDIKKSSEIDFNLLKKDADEDENNGIIEVLSIPESRPKRKPIPLDFGPADSMKSNTSSQNPVHSLKEKINKSKNQSTNDAQKEDTSIKPLNPEDIEGMNNNFIVDSSSSDEENENNEKKENINNENENKNENENIVKNDANNENKDVPNDSKDAADNSKQMDEHEKLANEIQNTADLLLQCLEKAKTILSENYTDEEEIQAQQNLKNLIDSFNTQEKRRKEIAQRMKDASQKLLDLSSEAEKMSSDANQLISSFSNE